MDVALQEILQAQKDAMSKTEALQRQMQQEKRASANGDGGDGVQNTAGSSAGIVQPPLKIASFNIQVFGEKKMGKDHIAEVLIKILQRYDLILILEIRDSSETALDELVEECNKVNPEDPFSSVVSARLGRTVSKEQYGFLYRASKVQVTDTYQFDDGADDGTDMFQREPFVVRFHSPTTELQDFAIIATHTDPDEAVKEIGALHKVYDASKNHWNLEDILIAGDFNADESYVNHDEWGTMKLRTDSRFKWLIEDSTDTTTGQTDRAYDRFVVAGSNLMKNVVPGRTGVFKFDKAYGLSYDEACDVSDHYPIEMQLTGKLNRPLQSRLDSGLSVTVLQKIPIEKDNDIRRIYRAEVGSESAHFTSRVNYDDSRMNEVVATRENVDDVITALEEFQTAFPNVVNDGTLAMVRAYIEGSNVFKPPSDPKHPYVYGLADCSTRGTLDVTVTAKLQQPLTCSVTVTMRMS